MIFEDDIYFATNVSPSIDVFLVVVVGSMVICVISDRHISILRVFREPDLSWHTESGQAYHIFCSRHIVQNFQRHINDKKLAPFVRGAIRQNQPRKFHLRMRNLTRKRADAA
jgi:hypothetical protein